MLQGSLAGLLHSRLHPFFSLTTTYLTTFVMLELPDGRANPALVGIANRPCLDATKDKRKSAEEEEEEEEAGANAAPRGEINQLEFTRSGPGEFALGSL